MTCLLIGCASTKSNSSKKNSLNGSWIPTRQELGGKELPAAMYDKYKLTIEDSIYTYGTAAVDKGVLKYNDGKMDIYGKEGVNKNKHFTAIYKVENGILTICYNLAGDSYPAAYETNSKPTLFISVFKKEGARYSIGVGL